MKQLIIFFLFISSLSAYGQVSLWLEAKQCFDQGNYICAEAKYREVFKTAVGKDKQTASIKIDRAKECKENLKNAVLAFNSKNYTKAQELYSAILLSNPNDNNAKSQLVIINSLLIKPIETSLNLSKTEINYKSSGSDEFVDVFTNSKSYTIDQLPSWCTVRKHDTYFVVNCSVNYQNTTRSTFINVKAGNKTIRVNITQDGATQKTETSLSLSKTNLFFSKNGGDENIIVFTNFNDFSVTSIPSWCTIQKFSNSITITCLNNNSNRYRSEWFKVIADNKEVKVSINQTGLNNQEPKYTNKKSFSSIGLQSGEIAKFGLMYEYGGRSKLGFHISVGSSLISKQDILSGKITENKNNFDLGPNFRVFNWLYLNIGVGYGFYNYAIRNDYTGRGPVLGTEKYIVSTGGLMLRLGRVNLSGGVSFMDIDKGIYKPEITGGLSFNLKSK